MFQIQSHQLGQIEQSQANAFEVVLAEHIRTFAPAAFASMGEAAASQTAHLAIERAQHHGFTLTGPTRFYLEMMLMFGASFDTDPQYRWAADALVPGKGLDELLRADQLHAAMIDYLGTAAGEDLSYERQAYRRLLDQLPDLLDASTSSEITRQLTAIYPEKAEVIGPDACAGLIDEAFAAADQLGPDWATGPALFAALMATFGHGCLDDPQYPWISKSVREVPADEDSAPRLARKFRTYLGAVAMKAS